MTAFTFSVSCKACETITLTDRNGDKIGSFTPENAFSVLTVSSAQADGNDLTVLVGGRTVESGAAEDSVSSATVNVPGGTDNSENRGHSRKGH